MASPAEDRGDKLHLVWVYPADLSRSLDAATWLDTTRELRKMGWRVDLIAVGPAGLQLARGTEYLGIQRPEIYFIRQGVFHLRLLSRLLRQWRSIDVVMFHQMSAAWLLPLRMAPRARKNWRPLLVMDTRTIPMDHLKGVSLKSRLRAWYYGGVRIAANRWADGRLAITSRMAESERIPAAKLWGTWSSGVDLEMFRNAFAERRWPEDGEAVRLVYVGSLNRERNLMALCEAVMMANAKGMLFHLTLVGDGSQRDELARAADASDRAIEVQAPIPHEDIPRVLCQNHVGVLPFPDEVKFRVSSPIKLFEYMAAGMPILATRIVCHTDIIGERKCVFWANNSDSMGLFDALNAVWQQRGSFSERASEALAAAQDWTWQATAARLDTALRHGLSQHWGARAQPAQSFSSRTPDESIRL